MSKMSIPNYRPYLGSVIFNALIHIWINSASHKQCKPYLIVVICGKAKRIRTNEHPVMKRRQYTRFLLNFSSQATYAFVPSKVKVSKTEKCLLIGRPKSNKIPIFFFFLSMILTQVKVPLFVYLYICPQVPLIRVCNTWITSERGC